MEREDGKNERKNLLFFLSAPNFLPHLTGGTSVPMPAFALPHSACLSYRLSLSLQCVLLESPFFSRGRKFQKNFTSI